MKISKITVARLFNLGSYEHVRYELTVDVSEKESTSAALIGLERILNCLSPNTHTKTRAELKRSQQYLLDMLALLRKEGAEEFRRRHGHFEGTPKEYIKRCTKNYLDGVRARIAWECKQEKARKMLDDLGGAAKWTDAKLTWEDDND